MYHVGSIRVVIKNAARARRRRVGDARRLPTARHRAIREDWAAGPRVAAGEVEAGAAGGQDGIDSSSAGGEAVINAEGESADDTAETGAARAVAAAADATVRSDEHITLADVVDAACRASNRVWRIDGVRVVDAGGVTILGVPVGTDKFVGEAAAVKVDQLKGNLNKLQTMLYSGLTYETAWLLLTFCHVPAVDFLMAQLYPTCSAGPLVVFDAAVERCARVVLGGAGPAIFDHPLIRRRVRLPIRRNGFGLRSRAEVAPAAFCGRVLAVAEAMFEVAPATARDVFGVSKFRNGEGRFREFLREGGSRLGREFGASWTRMKDETDGNGFLKWDACSAGRDAKGHGYLDTKAAHAIQAAREDVEEAALRAAFAALPHESLYERGVGSREGLPRAAQNFLVADAFSGQFLRSIPFSAELLFTNAAWAVAVATYAGVPIPQAAPFVGVPLKCKSPNKPILDPYADRLFNAPQVMNIGNNRTRWHDTCQRAVLDTARNAGLRVEEGLVIQLCTEGLGGDASKAWDKLVESDGGDLEGSIVPDIAIEDILYDVKTVAATTEHYAPGHIEAYMKAEYKRGNAPVDRRARLVNGQYLKKAHNLDVKYNSVGGVECGPMENTIRSRGEVCGLAFGSAGEASADVHRLARVCADEIAGKQFRKGLIDADSVEDAAAMIQAQIYREWGVAIVKGRAECLLALLECTVPNASPRSKVACGKSRDKLIERANVAHCSGGFAEAVQLRRRYAVMKEAARARRR